MMDSKVIEVLRTFDKQSLNHLELFIKSPLYNKKRDVTVLLNYLIKLAPSFDNDKKLVKGYIFRKIFPNKAYNADKMQRLINALLKVIEKFIAHKNLSENEIAQKLAQLKYYQNMNLTVHFESIQNQLSDLLLEKNTKDEMDFFNLHHLSLYCFNYFSVNNSLKRKEFLGLSIEYLQLYYLISLLKLLCHASNHKNVIKYEYDLTLIDAIIKQVQSNKFSESLILKAYFNILMFIIDYKKEENFKIVKFMIMENQLHQHKDDEKIIFDFLTNFCAMNINIGKTAYYEESFQLFQFGLDREILLVNNYLFPSTIKNIITTGLRLGKLDWVESFLKDYEDKIQPEIRDDILNYHFAQLLFYRKKYDKALDYLNESSYKDEFFKIDAKKLKVKIYYEQEEVDLLDSYIGQFYIYNYRNKLLSENHIETNKNFINLLKQLNNVATGDIQKLKRIQNKLNKIEKVAERLWLNEKIVEKIA